MSEEDSDVPHRVVLSARIRELAAKVNGPVFFFSMALLGGLASLVTIATPLFAPTTQTIVVQGTVPPSPVEQAQPAVSVPPTIPQPDKPTDSRLADPEYWRPNAAAGVDSGWSFHLDSAISARYVGYRLYYSLDGKHFEEASRRNAFDIRTDPPNGFVDIRVELSNGQVVGPFRYEFDFGTIKADTILDEIGSGNYQNSMVFRAKSGSRAAFHIVASFRDDGLRLRAVTTTKIAMYRIDFGDGFYQDFEPNGDQMAMFSIGGVPWPQNNTIRVQVVGDQGTLIGTEDFTIDLIRLRTDYWETNFNAADAIRCVLEPELRAVGNKNIYFDQVVCNQGGSSLEGLLRIDMGTEPDALTTQYDVGAPSNCDPNQESCCFAIGRFEGRPRFIYSKLHYLDGRASTVQRYAVTFP